jgi:hypothetical protein
LTEFVSGSIFVRTMGENNFTVQPGEAVGGHVHNFDHTSIFFNGLWHVRKWTPEGELEHDFEREGPFFLLIDKDCMHEFIYPESNTEPGHAWCVYSHRTPQGEVSLVETGWMNAYDAKEPPR